MANNVMYVPAKIIKKPFSFSRLVFVFAIVFLFLPLIVITIYSFNDQKAWIGVNSLYGGI